MFLPSGHKTMTISFIIVFPCFVAKEIEMDSVALLSGVIFCSSLAMEGTVIASLPRR